MANNSIIVKPQGQTHILVGNSANRTPIVVNPSSTGCSGGGGGSINITPYITEDGGNVVFNYFTPKQMAEVYMWLEGGNLRFELTKDEEGQYSLLTKSDIQELDGMFVMGGEEHDLDTIVDTIPVYLNEHKVSEVRIKGIYADLLNADFTWKLAEIGNKIDNIQLPEIDTTDIASKDLERFFGLPAALPDGYEFMTPEEVCSELEDIMTSMDIALTQQQAQEITQQTLTQQ